MCRFSSFFQYQWVAPEGPQDPAVVPTPPDQQRRVRQAQQGHPEHAPHRRALRRLGLPEPGHHQEADLQARALQTVAQEDPDHGQRLHRASSPYVPSRSNISVP